jgi:hypothetical protein
MNLSETLPVTTLFADTSACNRSLVGVTMHQNGTVKQFKCWPELKYESKMILSKLQTTICIYAGTFLYKSVYFNP